MLQRYKLYFGLCLGLLALTSVAASAQAQTTATAQAPPPKLSIIIDRNLLRFAAPGDGQEWRLEVFNQAGEQVFDSGSVMNQALEWPLQDQQGQPVASGLYAYTLTIKDQTGAAGRRQRGHIIVNRASSADRVWITSNSAVGVGAPTAEPELTVVGADESTLGGAKVAEQTARAISESGTGRTTTESRRDEVTRTVQDAAAGSRSGSENQPKNTVNLLVDGSGTPGRIAKFTTNTSIVDSMITETNNGNIGLGTQNPGQKLDVEGNVIAANGPNAVAVTNDTTGTHFWTNNLYNRSAPFTNWTQTLNMRDGKVGIGTTGPGATLEVQGSDDPLLLVNHTGASGNPAIWFQQNGDTKAFVWWDQISSRLNLGTPTTNPIISLQNNGKVGIGTTNPLALLQVEGSTDTIHVHGPGASYSFGNRETAAIVGNPTAGERWVWYASNGAARLWSGTDKLMITPSGNIGIGTGNPTAKLDVAGMTKTQVLQITGGADLSESFEVKATLDAGDNASTQQIRPGMVVSIDPDNPGKLVISSRAYDRGVAGIISGAGGVKPGMLMSQSGSIADGTHPVALNGRVYCWADAANGPINPGDLLTTSNLPGYAMKVIDHGKAQGAIIGKAMTALPKGRGLVLILVALQ